MVLLAIAAMVVLVAIPGAVREQSDPTATRLNSQVQELYSAERYKEAMPLAQQAVAITEKALGPEHPDTATSLNDLANLYQATGAYAQAEPLFKRALAIREKVFGPEHPATATSLNNLAALHDTMGAYAQAEPLYKRALAIREKVLGAEHPDTEVSLNNLAFLYNATGAYAQAEPLYKRALAIAEKTLGPEHPGTARSLNNLASHYEDTGAYARAESLYKRALAIREKVLGPEHSATARSLNNLALLYEAMGAYARAEPLFKRALAIHEKALGPEHPDTATSLNNLAGLYGSTGAYAQAEPFYKRALAIDEKVLGPEHPDTATSLNNLAFLYDATGAYAQAEPLYKRALAIREKALGPEHPATATSLNNLADLYRGTGAYAQAEPLYKRALAIDEKVLGPEHPATATSLNNLAVLYDAMGAYAQAEPLYRRALAIDEKVLGPEHPATATSLNNLAALYWAKDAYAQAEPLFKRALAIDEKVLGQEHPATATSLNNLANLYRAQGAYAQAEPLFKRALAIQRNVLGPAHPDAATSLNNLAALYQTTGSYAQAKPLVKRALAIREKVLGPEHPDTATSLSNLAILFWAQNHWSESAASMQRSLRIEETNARRALLLGDEPRKRAYAATLTRSSWAAVSFSLASRGKVAGAEHLGLEMVLQRKGQVQDLMTDVFAAARTSLVASDREVFDQWREANAQLATLSFRGPGQMPLDKYRELLEALSTKAASLEAQLSERSAEFRSKVEAVTVERVQQVLPTDSALVEWLRYEPLNPSARGEEPNYGNPRYVAYVLKREGQPVAIDLGEAQPIEKALAELLQALAGPGGRGTKRAAPMAEIARVGQLARALDAKVMQPLRPHWGDAKQLLISPDGALNLLPFGVLRDEQGRYLVQQEELAVTYLTSGRDLLRPGRNAPSRQAALVLADPDFGPLDKATLAAAAETPSAARRSSDAGALQFKRLLGTAAEARALKDELKLEDEQVLTQGRATEAVLKQARGPRILHLATHGFFLPDQPVDPKALSPALASDARPSAPKGENPLLRSGLAFAGANQLRSGKDDDGLLTAQEVAGLDLQGTELAVLSACETGVGKVENGEGVYGLRRAFVLAGVRTQVASLWQVDDEATKDLMLDYYRRLNAGAGRSQALRDAQRAMLADAKHSYRAHPYYWAAFVVIGDGAALPR
jgi:CHAT domain-containing protein/tetratricopeptide (TPR) repeat protein